MQSLLDVLSSVMQEFWKVVATMVGRFTGEPNYRAGFCTGAVVAVALIVVGSVINYAWARINKFFKSIKVPVTAAAGEKPVGTAAGCALGALVLVVLVLVGLSFVSFMAPR